MSSNPSRYDQNAIDENIMVQSGCTDSTMSHLVGSTASIHLVQVRPSLERKSPHCLAYNTCPSPMLSPLPHRPPTFWSARLAILLGSEGTQRREEGQQTPAARLCSLGGWGASTVRWISRVPHTVVGTPKSSTISCGATRNNPKTASVFGRMAAQAQGQAAWCVVSVCGACAAVCLCCFVCVCVLVLCSLPHLDPPVAERCDLPVLNIVLVPGAVGHVLDWLAVQTVRAVDVHALVERGQCGGRLVPQNHLGGDQLGARAGGAVADLQGQRVRWPGNHHSKEVPLPAGDVSRALEQEG